MIFLEFEEPDDQDWKNWVKSCEEATEDLITSYANNEPDNITDLYKAQSAIYEKPPFNGKCAYCESKREENSPVYVEHYRPKGGVRDMDNNRIMVQNENKEELPHPGYYWLAYNWQNFLPTCWACNTWQEKLQIGKGQRFPVDGMHATEVGTEDQETPLLINPMYVDPDIHLNLDRVGVMHEVDGSSIGKITIELFGLNEREALPKARKEVYKSVRDKIKIIYLEGENNPDLDTELQELEAIKNGGGRFTMAVRKAIVDQLETFTRLSKRIEP